MVLQYKRIWSCVSIHNTTVKDNTIWQHHFAASFLDYNGVIFYEKRKVIECFYKRFKKEKVIRKPGPPFESNPEPLSIWPWRYTQYATEKFKALCTDSVIPHIGFLKRLRDIVWFCLKQLITDSDACARPTLPLVE